MNTVKITKEKLLLALKENRNRHEEEFNTAYAVWLSKSIEVYEFARLEFAAGKKIKVEELDQPISHLKEYDRIIEQIDWNEEKVVELDFRQFNQFVRDEWDWMESFKYSSSSSSSSTSSYVSYED